MTRNNLSQHISAPNERIILSLSGASIGTGRVTQRYGPMKKLLGCQENNAGTQNLSLKRIISALRNILSREKARVYTPVNRKSLFIPVAQNAGVLAAMNLKSFIIGAWYLKNFTLMRVEYGECERVSQPSSFSFCSTSCATYGRGLFAN